MKRRIHALAGITGFLAILVFWSSTVASELFLTPAHVVWVKSAILFGLAVLIPAMIVAGASGMAIGRRRRDVPALAKKRRMPVIALNGVLVLVPAAVYLQVKASAAEFDTLFYSVQALELLAGLINLVLMGLNIRDGRAMAARRRLAGA